MRFLIDENLPPLLARRLERLRHDVERIAAIDAGATDEEVLHIAQEREQVVITQDKGLGALAFAGAVAPPGLILVRLPRSAKQALVDRVVDELQQQDDWAGWSVTILRRRVRRRRMPR